MTTEVQTDLRSILHALPHQDPRFEPWIDEGTGYQPFLEVARRLQPESILEFGALLGYSLVAFLEGCPSIEFLHWVDDECYLPNSNVLAAQNIEAYCSAWNVSMPYIKWHEDAWEAAAYGPTHSLVHIDGDHSTLGKLRDLVITHDVIKPRWILVDDLIKPPVWAGLNSFLRAVPDTYQSETIEPNRGLVLLTRRDQ